MTERSMPWADGVGVDGRSYTNVEWALMFSDYFLQGNTDAATLNASVLEGTGNGTDDPLAVTETGPASNDVEVKQGSALINGYYYNNSSDVTFTITANNDASGDDRIDSVVLQWDSINSQIRLAVIEGTVDPSPVAPTLTRTATIYEALVSNIAVANGFTTIVDANIDNTVVDQGIVWNEAQGGTGVSNSYTKGDILIATGVSSLAQLPVGANVEQLVADSAQTEGVAWIDSRTTTLWEASTAANSAFITSPIVMDSSHDPAGNLAVFASDKWELDPGTYQMVGGGVSYWNIDVSAGGNVYFYLYDFTAAAILLDTDGATIQTVMSPVHVQSANTSVWLGQEFVVDGTESIGMLGAVSGTGFLATDVRGGYAVARTVPWSISFKRIR